MVFFFQSSCVVVYFLTGDLEPFIVSRSLFAYIYYRQVLLKFDLAECRWALNALRYFKRMPAVLFLLGKSSFWTRIKWKSVFFRPIGLSCCLSLIAVRSASHWRSLMSDCRSSSVILVCFFLGWTICPGFLIYPAFRYESSALTDFFSGLRWSVASVYWQSFRYGEMLFLRMIPKEL